MKTTTGKWTALRAGCLAAAAWLGIASAADAGGFTVDRQGAWKLVQEDAGGGKALFLENKSGNVKTLLASVEVPAATVTNVYWDAYAGIDEATGQPVGGVVTNVDTVAADYQFKAFVNNGQAYWSDWSDGTARLWTAPCASPEGKTLLGKAAAGAADDAFEARAWRRGATWRQVSPDGGGMALMVRENGKTRRASVRQLVAPAKAKAVKVAKARAAKYYGSGDYSSSGSYYGSGDYDYSGSGSDYDYSGSGSDYDYSGSGSDYDYSGSGSDYDYSGSMPDYDCQYVFFDANGGVFENGDTRWDSTATDNEYRINSTGIYEFWYTGYFQFPTRAGHSFNGWYTAPTGGTRVKEGDPVTSEQSRTLYAHWLPTSGTSIPEATDCDTLTFTFEGDVPWFGQKDVSHDGVDAARSGQLAPGHIWSGSSVMSTTLKGPGKITFWWKVDAESYWYGYSEGRIDLLLDDNVQARIEGQTDWTKQSIDIESGTHTLKWRYVGPSRYSGLDCGWVDQIVWEWEGGQTVTFEAQGGVCATETKVYAQGETYETLPDATKEGYDFEGWFTEASGGTQVKVGDQVPETKARTLWAHWKPGEQTVTFDANGGTCGTATAKYTVEGVYGSLPKAEKEGYDFDGWFTAQTGGDQVAEGDTVPGAWTRTLYAHWTAGTQEVTFNANGGRCDTEKGYYTVAEPYGFLPDAKRQRYEFDGWFTSASGGTQVTDDDTVPALWTRTLWAHWTPGTQTVFLDAAGGTCEQDVLVYDMADGTTYAGLPKPKKDGAAFVGWFTAAEGGARVHETDQVTAASSRTFYARWAETVQTVTFDANGGTCAAETEYYEMLDPYGSLPVPTRDWATFLGWFTAEEGGTEVTAESLVTFAAARTLYAHWDVEEPEDLPTVTEMAVGTKDGKMAFSFRATAGGASAVQVKGTETLLVGDEGWQAIGDPIPVPEGGELEIDDFPVPEGWQNGYFRVEPAEAD